MNRQSFRKKYRRIRALSGRTVKELVRDPLSWIFALAFPLVMLALFTVINSKIPPEAGMTQFAPVSVGPGILVFAQSFLILFVSLLVSGDRDSALLTRLQVTPAAPSEFHLGYTLPAVLLGLVQGFLTMTVVWVLSLSGGEAQRVKLATELSRRSTGKTIYILDEPTTGLHFADVHKLIEILHRLTDGGNTVLVIEHNLDVIKTADYIIDIGPDGGDRGGTVIAQGTPEEVAESDVSYTGKYIKKYLERDKNISQ